MLWRLSVALAVVLLGALALITSASQPSDAHLVSTYTWTHKDERFGGISGLEVTEDGLSFVAVGDRGTVFEGQFKRNFRGKISGVETKSIQPLRDSGGNQFKIAFLRDAEGVAIGTDGRIYVSFEGQHRVVAYKTLKKSMKMPRPWKDSNFQSNSSFESLAIDDKNRLYVIPERSGALSKPFPVYRYEKGRWNNPFDIPRSDGFLPVGADFGPDGMLYLLERSFSGLRFSSRVRRFIVTETSIEEEAVLITPPVGSYGNLEGLSVWQDDNGNIRMTMVSDDNFRFFQSTQFVEYVLKE